MYFRNMPIAIKSLTLDYLGAIVKLLPEWDLAEGNDERCR